MTPNDDCIALSVLREIGAQLPTGSLASSTKIARSDLTPVRAGLRGDAYDARIRQLLAPWQLGEIDVARLERAWKDEFDQSPSGVSVERLRVLARDCSSGFYDPSGELEAWRFRLSFRLNEAGVPVASQQGVAAAEEGELDFQAVGHEWPHELLNGDRYKWIPSLLPEARLPLDGAWVELRLVDADLMQASSISSPSGSAGGDPAGLPWEQRYGMHQSRSLGLGAALDSLSRLTYVVGDPGSGKTTIVHWLARETIRDPDAAFLLPLVVRLREYGLERPREGILAHALRKCGVRDAAQVELWKHALERQTRRDSRSVVLLLDGLDELPGRSDELESLRHEVVDELQELAKRFTVIVTSRPSGMPSLHASGDSLAYRIAELSPGGCAELLEQWCGLSGMHDEQVAQLKDHLNLQPDLQRMARNPFLLTCICAIANQALASGKPLPTRRTDIYDGCLDLVSRVRYPGQVRAFGDGDRRQLASLAYWLLKDAPESPRLVFDLNDVRAVCEQSDFFAEVVTPGRLVSQWDVDDGTLYFTHATFQEFLAAEHVQKALSDEARISLADECLLAPAWKEVMTFCAAYAPSVESALWERARALAKSPDRFGVVFVRFAHWLAEAGVDERDYSLVGDIDVFKKLWVLAHDNIDPVRYLSACAAQAPLRFGELVAAGRADGSLRALRSELTLVLKRIPIPAFSELVTDDLLDAGLDSSPHPTEHRLATASLERLRRELDGGQLTERVAKRVIQALGLARDHGSISALERIAATTGPLRANSLEALGLIGGPKAYEALEKLLDKADSADDWKAAVQGLGNMHEARARDRLLRELALLEDLDDERASVILCELQDHVIGSASTYVLEFLQSPDEGIREYAACVLYKARRSEEVSAALTAVARRDPSSVVRSAALLSLEHHVRESDFGWLEQVVRSRDLEMEERDAALMATGDLLLHDPTLTSKLESLLLYGLEQPDLQRTAVSILGTLGKDRSVPLLELLATALDTERASNALPTDVVIEEVCRVFGDLKAREALPHLHELMKVDHLGARVQEAAARAITCIAPETLVEESSPIAARVLGKYSLETGCLAIDGELSDSNGHVVGKAAGEPAAAASTSMSIRVLERLNDIAETTTGILRELRFKATPAPQRRQMNKRQREVNVERQLAGQPLMTAKAVAERIGCSESAVKKTEAWTRRGPIRKRHGRGASQVSLAAAAFQLERDQPTRSADNQSASDALELLQSDLGVEQLLKDARGGKADRAEIRKTLLWLRNTVRTAAESSDLAEGDHALLMQLEDQVTAGLTELDTAEE